MAKAKPNRTKSQPVNFRITPQDYEKIKNRAAIARMNISEFIRTMCLEGKIVVVPGMVEAAKELNRIGVNLNQLTRSANDGTIRCIDLSETKLEVGRVWQFLNSQTLKVR